MLANLFAGISLVSTLLSPAMPRKMTELRAKLGLDTPALSNAGTWNTVKPGTRLSPDAPILFAKREI